MPDPMTKEKRAELRKLAEAATAARIAYLTNFSVDTHIASEDANFAFREGASEEAFLSLLDALDAAEAEAGRLREVVGKLPVTADGVPVTPGMKVFWVSEDPRSIAGIMVEYITDADAYWRDRGEEMGIPLEWAMSTEAAARAAQGISDAGKGKT